MEELLKEYLTGKARLLRMEAKLLEQLSSSADSTFFAKPRVEESAQSKEEPSNGLVRLSEILELIPVSRSTWWQGVKDGTFPKPIKLGSRISTWKRKDILELINPEEGNS